MSLSAEDFTGNQAMLRTGHDRWSSAATTTGAEKD
jgi:hypothetical protein